MTAPRFGLIGFGAMARTVTAQLRAGLAGPEGLVPAAVLLAPGQSRGDLPDLPAETAVAKSAHQLAHLAPDGVAECAAPAAVREIVPAVLAAGTDVVLATVGPLAEEGLYSRLAGAAHTGRARLTIPSGAVAGLDALAAARGDGLAEVTHTVAKPARAWVGTPAEAAVDLASLDAPKVLFSGDAGTAAQRFPQNANAAVTIALAGAGLGGTTTRLLADPGLEANEHRITATGAFGTLSVTVANTSLAANPKTSRLAALSVARALVARQARVAI